MKTKTKKVEFTKTDRDNKHDMQWLENGGIICYEDSLPRGMAGCKELFLDFETTSCDPDLDSLDPWRHCWICGVAICCDDGPAYYVPVDQENENRVYDWLFEIFSHPNLHAWINHNIKYDAHVLANNSGIIPECKLIDTVTMAKLIDSDRFQHNLTVLAKDWLDEDISKFEERLAPYKHQNKDYGNIPLDIIAPYACQDVLTNRKLYRYMQERLPAECNLVRDTEIRVTSALFRMERRGLRVDPLQLDMKELEVLSRCLQIEERLEKITGRSFRPHTNADCFDVLCNYYGLPVLGWTEKGEPSFDKDTIALYAAHPRAQEGEIQEVVMLVIEYRKLKTLDSLFIQKFKELHINNILHCNYNQTVRTGRLSCSDPNMQQNSKASKELIHPLDGDVFIGNDYSQIEFRTIAHYIENPFLLKSYRENPDIDFHKWVAEMCSIARKPAKNINFMLGFGGGKEKTIKMLEANMELVGALMEQVREMGVEEALQQDAFHKLARQRAVSVYNTYHRTLPELKKVSRKAGAVCGYRGYVFNFYGRQRHLPSERAHIAFNFLNQSTAADLMKERLAFLDDLLRDTEIKIVASVHDELLFSMPKELAEDQRITDTIAHLMETPILPEGQEFLVPIRVAAGKPASNWREASGSAELQNYEKAIPIHKFQKLVGK